MKNKTGSFSVVGLLLPVVLSFWLLAAHFLRVGDMAWFFGLVIFPLLLLVKHPITVRVIQFCLVAVAGTWGLVTYQMLMERMIMGADWQRLTIIMGGVICFTLLSACSFLHSRLEKHYGVK
ncbi:hypothetical protein MD588_03150 [Photobacterium sp. SDRW27]|uniref:hypothetical protein n=1 Tax=Photobacterium obscurum TaxID=2829490 RepID=UPI0022445B54|nr:hypothetical protein [Photobacterium obscurum]MCW8327793.1 hypothetical protein [Photobacterium obscurum]